MNIDYISHAHCLLFGKLLLETRSNKTFGLKAPIKGQNTFSLQFSHTRGWKISSWYRKSCAIFQTIPLLFNVFCSQLPVHMHVELLLQPQFPVFQGKSVNLQQIKRVTRPKSLMKYETESSAIIIHHLINLLLHEISGSSARALAISSLLKMRVRLTNALALPRLVWYCSGTLAQIVVHFLWKTKSVR